MKNMIETNILRGTYSRKPCSHSPNVLWTLANRGVFCNGCQDYVYLSCKEETEYKYLGYCDCDDCVEALKSIRAKECEHKNGFKGNDNSRDGSSWCVDCDQKVETPKYTRLAGIQGRLNSVSITSAAIGDSQLAKDMRYLLTKLHTLKRDVEEMAKPRPARKNYTQRLIGLAGKALESLAND